MPRRKTCTDIFDEVRQIDIAWLRKEGHLEPGRRTNGWILRWKHGGSVVIDVDTGLSFVNLNYWVGDERRSYTVRLKSRPSNLGKGLVWYFVCPATGRLCRKLYAIDGYYHSRHAFPSAMYRSQIEPKSERWLRRYISLNGTTKNPKAKWDIFDRRRFRAYYSGKPTKHYLGYLERTKKIQALLEGPIVREAVMRLRAETEKLMRACTLFNPHN